MIFDTNNPLDIAMAMNRGVAGRVSTNGCEKGRVLTRHVGLKPDLHLNEQSGFNISGQFLQP